MKPDAFAAVMATGIVSIAAADHGYHVISDAWRLSRRSCWRPWWLRRSSGCVPDFDDVDVPLQLFTFVAACAVVGTRLHSSPFTHATLGVAAALAWLGLAILTAPAAVASSVDRAARPRAWRLGTGERRDIWVGDTRRGFGLLVAGGRAVGLGPLLVRLDDWLGRLARVPRPVGAGVEAARYMDSDGRDCDRDTGGRSHSRGGCRGRSVR